LSLRTRRLAESFGGLNSSLAQSTGELWSCKDLPNMGKLYLLKRKSPGTEDVKQFAEIQVKQHIT